MCIRDSSTRGRSKTVRGREGIIVTALGEERLTLLEILGLDESEFEILLLDDDTEEEKPLRELVENKTQEYSEKPEEVFDLLFNREIPYWKIDEKPTTNGVYYEDRRTTEYNYSLKKVYEFLKELCGQTYYQPEIVTNVTKFYKDDYNDWKNCIWWPHRDSGYNGIIFFSDECGTNLYSPDYERDSVTQTHEHKHPWVKKGEYTVLKTLEPKFNKLVFFDGLKFPHGMDVSSDRYFGDDKSVIAGFGLIDKKSVLIIGQDKGENLDTRIDISYKIIIGNAREICENGSGGVTIAANTNDKTIAYFLNEIN